MTRRAAETVSNNLIRGVLENTSVGSGASIEYAQGVVCGVVTALMELDPQSSFFHAINYVKGEMPDSYRIEAIPETWRDLFDE